MTLEKRKNPEGEEEVVVKEENSVEGTGKIRKLLSSNDVTQGSQDANNEKLEKLYHFFCIEKTWQLVLSFSFLDPDKRHFSLEVPVTTLDMVRFQEGQLEIVVDMKDKLFAYLDGWDWGIDFKAVKIGTKEELVLITQDTFYRNKPPYHDHYHARSSDGYIKLRLDVISKKKATEFLQRLYENERYKADAMLEAPVSLPAAGYLNSFEQKEQGRIIRPCVQQAEYNEMNSIRSVGITINYEELVDAFDDYL